MHRRLTLILLLLLMLTAPAAAQESTPEATEAPDQQPYPNADLLVDVAWVQAHLDDPDVRLIDMRGRDDYAQAHIPGAANVPVGAISSTVNGIPMEFDEEEVQAVLDEIGLTPEMTAVIYDDLGMMNSARLFWTLEYVGHVDVRILNGGWNAWEEAGGKTTDTVPEFEATAYPIDLQADLLITAEDLLAQLDNPDWTIVDARSPEEYTGEASFSRRSGHIPGAVNLVWADTLTGGDTVYATDRSWQAELRDPDVEVFRSAAEIQAMLDELGITPDQHMVTYCQTLWRGAHVYFLLRLMGFEDVAGYDGSWAEWGERDDLPIVTGPEPGTPDAAE